jgi:hypothetical protein
MKLKEEVKREQGLAALALVNFAEVYEIAGGRRLEVGPELGIANAMNFIIEYAACQSDENRRKIAPMKEVAPLDVDGIRG